MNFNEVVDFLSHGDRVTETVVSPSDPSLLNIVLTAMAAAKNSFAFCGEPKPDGETN